MGWVQPYSLGIISAIKYLMIVDLTIYCRSLNVLENITENLDPHIHNHLEQVFGEKDKMYILNNWTSASAENKDIKGRKDTSEVI